MKLELHEKVILKFDTLCTCTVLVPSASIVRICSFFHMIAVHLYRLVTTANKLSPPALSIMI